MSEIKLYHGDCLELMKDIHDGSVDAIICDLPYGTTACKWYVVIPFEPLWAQYKRIIKKNGAIVLFGSEPFSSHLRLSNLKWYKYDWVWKKERGVGFQIAKYRPMMQTENVSVFGTSKTKYYPQMEKLDKPRIESFASSKSGSSPIANIVDGKRLATHRYPKNVLEISRDIDRIHPTQKPVALLEYLIKTYTLEGETVLDNCMGSGSTGVACINTNRKFIGIEKDETYFNIAKNRIEKARQEAESDGGSL